MKCLFYVVMVRMYSIMPFKCISFLLQSMTRVMLFTKYDMSDVISQSMVRVTLWGWHFYKVWYGWCCLQSMIQVMLFQKVWHKWHLLGMTRVTLFYKAWHGWCYFAKYDTGDAVFASTLHLSAVRTWAVYKVWFLPYSRREWEWSEKGEWERQRGREREQYL